jgi:hypothetical protein
VHAEIKKMNKPNEIKFIYMRSFGRSGETLLMRSLDAHQRIHALVQLLHRRKETNESYQLFRQVVDECPQSMPRSDLLRKVIAPHDKPTLLVKAAVWEPRPDAHGFVLIRNPMAVVHSYLKLFGSRLDKRKWRPIARWMLRIDRETAKLVNRCEILTAVCIAWNRRYADLSLRNIPIIYYENFIRNPDLQLRALLTGLDLPWDDAVLHSEKNYQPGEVGHGGIALSEPIHAGSLDSWKTLGDKRIAKIRALCYPIMHAYGYELKGGELHIDGQRRV